MWNTFNHKSGWKMIWAYGTSNYAQASSFLGTNLATKRRSKGLCAYAFDGSRLRVTHYSKSSNIFSYYLAADVSLFPIPHLTTQCCLVCKAGLVTCSSCIFFVVFCPKRRLLISPLESQWHAVQEPEHNSKCNLLLIANLSAMVQGIKSGCICHRGP